MRQLIAATLVLVPILLAAAPRAAGACSCIHGVTIQSSFDRADAVFTGQVASVKNNPDVGFIDMLEVELDVMQAFKGAPDDVMIVYTAAFGPACGYHFAMGEKHLIYASASENGYLFVNMCSRTRSLARAAEDLKVLAAHLETTWQLPTEPPADAPAADEPAADAPAHGQEVRPESEGDGTETGSATSTGTAAAVQTVPPRAGGCAGCSTSGPWGAGGALGTLAFVWLVFVWLVFVARGGHKVRYSRYPATLSTWP